MVISQIENKRIAWRPTGFKLSFWREMELLYLSIVVVHPEVTVDSNVNGKDNVKLA